MKRRHFLIGLAGVGGLSALFGRKLFEAQTAIAEGPKVDKIHRTDAEWRKLLTPQQYDILRNEGTERAGTSPLNKEHREGTYTCAGCELALFTSDAKYESGTGWPSFFKPIDGHIETKLDFKLIYPRTEYHCARCGGHQGHVFKDGPPPTGQRWCNNGLALKFVPAA